MSDGEVVTNFFSRLVLLTNQMKVCGEKITKLYKVDKVLRALTRKFDHIVVAIEESKNISNVKLKELQASLEAHEMRLKLIIFDKVIK